MKRIKKTPPKPRPASWEASTTMEHNGRKIERGMEITVLDHRRLDRDRPQRLRVRFIEHVKAPSGEWITVSEIDKATGKSRSTRSFDPSRIATVHRIKKSAPRPKKGRKS